MPVSSSVKSTHANFASARNVGNSRKPLRHNSSIMRHAHSLWAKGTAVQLAEITGYCERTAENWMGGHTRLPADALCLLLQSKWGRGFLAASMAEAEPTWWKKLKSFFNAIDVLSMQAITRRKIKETLDADFETAQALAHTSASLFQAEEFYSPAPRAAARGRAVVARR